MQELKAFLLFFKFITTFQPQKFAFISLRNNSFGKKHTDRDRYNFEQVLKG